MPKQPTDTDRRSFIAGLGAGTMALAGLAKVPSAWGQTREANAKSTDNDFYRQEGSDPTFKELLKQKAFPIGENSHTGVKGSTIHVNHRLLSKAPNANKPVPKDIFIHTLCNSLTKRKDFHKWTRWYQEDGSTQVFRLFKDEHNVRNDRPDAARIEAFSELQWTRGPWHAWQGTYTLVRPHNCAIFQAKNDDNDWGVMININSEGVVKLNHREGEDEILDRDMTGKSFVLGVRDNGHDYQVYYNHKKVGEGSYKRPTGKTRFRWGMYDGTLKHDAMIFVTGVKFE